MSLIGELRSSVDYYATLTGRNPVRHVVVTGGGSRLSGFVEQLQQQLRLPVAPGSALDRIDCSRLKLPPEEIGRLDSAVAVVVGLALPGPKGVKELDLLPPEVIAGRKRKRIERAFVLVGVVAVAAMAGLGVLRFLKVHDAENQVAALQGQIAGLKTQIPKFDKVQQEHAAILGLADISQPIVENEVYWPGVFESLAVITPKGGTISSFSGNTVPLPVPVATPGDPTPPPSPPQDVQTASLTIQMESTAGYPYFRSWYFSVSGSGKLTVNQFSGITQSTLKHVIFSATVGVTQEVRSIRAHEFEVPS